MFVRVPLTDFLCLERSSLFTAFFLAEQCCMVIDLEISASSCRIIQYQFRVHHCPIVLPPGLIELQMATLVINLACSIILRWNMSRHLPLVADCGFTNKSVQ